MENRKFIAITVFTFALLCSCKDKETIPIDHNTYYPSSNFSFALSAGQVESMSHDILITSLNFAYDTSLWHISGYPIVTVTSSTGYPRTITVDFGNSDTTTLLHTTIGDLRTRSGILSITLSDDWHNIGAITTITATSLCLSKMMTFTGNIEFANRGLQNFQSGQCYAFDFVTNNATINVNNSTSFQYDATKIYYLTSGDTSTTLTDDVFQIFGSSNATKDSNNIEIEILGPYLAPHSCFWFKSGNASLKENTIKRTLSFENSNCSPIAYIYFKTHEDSPSEMKRYIDLP